MPKIERVMELAGYRREDLSLCLGCKICASVCTVNDLSPGAGVRERGNGNGAGDGTGDPAARTFAVNPQEVLVKLFLGEEIDKDHPLVRYCTSCYRCTGACPWKIRIPEVVRALKECLDVASPFEKAFKGSVNIWGRVYEPYVFLMAIPFLLREGYVKHMAKWTEYMSIHLPHKVKRLKPSESAKGLEGRT